jgi:hypothetical protein
MTNDYRAVVLKLAFYIYECGRRFIIIIHRRVFGAISPETSTLLSTV